MPIQISAVSGNTPMPELTKTETLAEELKLAMRRFAAGVTVITASADRVRDGLTATAVSSLSMDPPSLVTCVNRATKTLPLIVKSGRFCINLLSAEQRDIAQAFAAHNVESGDDKFLSVGDWDEDESRLPMLRNCLANIVCEYASHMDVGTHRIIVGVARIVRCLRPFKPLIYVDRHFTTTRDHKSGSMRQG